MGLEKPSQTKQTSWTGTTRRTGQTESVHSVGMGSSRTGVGDFEVVFS